MLLDEFPNLVFSISCTTRKRREGEVDGKDYLFLDRENFVAKRNMGEFAEWANVHGNYYGTPLRPLQEQLRKGLDVLLDVDVQGAAQIRCSLPETFFVFIVPPGMKELEKRLRRRNTDSEHSIKCRLENACPELRQASWYDALIVNDDLDKAYARLRAVYMAATLSPIRNRALLDSLLTECMEKPE